MNERLDGLTDVTAEIVILTCKKLDFIVKEI